MLTMLTHSGTNSHFRIAVGSGRVDMVDTVLEQQVENAVSFCPASCRSEPPHRELCGALMAGASE
jgi:hypothetical protein